MYHRLLRSGDFAALVPLLPAGFRVSDRLRQRLPAVWRRLHVAGQLHGGVVVDPERQERDRIVAFGLTTFLTERFVREFLDAPVPYVSGLVYERVLADRSPLLDASALPRANATADLNLLILHFGMHGGALASGRAPAIASVAQEGFRLTHVGYGIRRVLQEAYGEDELPFFRAGGFLLKHDFSHVLAGTTREPPTTRPYLMGLFRDDAESRYPGNGMSYLFQRAQPKIRFSAAEQRVLLRAVMDDPDDAIADALGVSHDAIKKVWRRIHERVAAAAPDLSVEIADGSESRGKEKRRRLLQYLRYHLEELRPFASGRQGGARRGT